MPSDVVAYTYRSNRPPTSFSHILNATEDVANFFCDSPHLHYHRCPIKDRSESAPDMEAHFPDCVRFIDR
jgi:hypothetical protein